jgi:hypothetical protein
MVCHFQIKSAPFLIDFHFKSALIDFGFLTTITRFVVGFVGMWVPQSGIQVIVGRVEKSSVISRMENGFPIG